MHAASAILIATAAGDGMARSGAFASSQPATVAPESLRQGFILIVRDRSGLAGSQSPPYLASNRNGWNPGDAAMRLSARSDGRWQVLVPHSDDRSPLEFKFTRGGWDTVEVASDLSDIPNRRLAPLDASGLKPNEPATIELTIEKFADQRPDVGAKKAADPYRNIHAVGTVRRVQVVGGGVAGLVRDALVWLPPGYDEPENAERRYPVLYLQDGQTVFEQPPGVPGEWRADETATELVRTGRIEPLIIVAIPNAGMNRTPEYLPVSGPRNAEPHADEYVSFVLREVMPRVERAFRIETGPEHTGIGGASLGGLVSLYAATRHPEVFGRVLAESPSLVLGERALWKDLFGSVRRWPERVYIGMGGREASQDPGGQDENQKHVDAAAALDSLVAGHVSAADHKLVIDPEAIHNENAWAARFPAALEFLFPANRASR
jgi:predicted alpha/beta superfamily hydrolase